MKTVVVAGAVANKNGNAGEAWVRMTWAAGLRDLGLDVFFLEQIDPASCTDEDGGACAPGASTNRRHFEAVTRGFGFGSRSALVTPNGERVCGLDEDEVADLARDADLLVNMSGHLTLEPFLTRVPRRAYIDLDPGFTHFWHEAGVDAGLEGHNAFFTVGSNIGSTGCAIPSGGLEWRPIRPPVLLDRWCPDEDGETSGSVEAGASPTAMPAPRFTTIASWRGAFGPIRRAGRRYGVKAHRFRHFLELPGRSPGRFEIALDIDPDDRADLGALRSNGWHVVDPGRWVPDPEAYRAYIQSSDAEFSAAQEIYVETRSGWFSDRTALYLACGKPVLVEDTGIADDLASGVGLVTFETLEEAADGAARIGRHYAEHSQAARALAERHLDSRRVLGGFLERVERAA
jgi:hypothetical protein